MKSPHPAFGHLLPRVPRGRRGKLGGFRCSLHFAEALRASGGQIIDGARIPHDLIQAALDYAAAEAG